MQQGVCCSRRHDSFLTELTLTRPPGEHTTRITIISGFKLGVCCDLSTSNVQWRFHCSLMSVNNAAESDRDDGGQDFASIPHSLQRRERTASTSVSEIPARGIVRYYAQYQEVIPPSVQIGVSTDSVIQQLLRQQIYLGSHANLGTVP